ALDDYAGWERGQQARRRARIEHDEHAAVVGTAHQPAERLLEAEAGQHVVIGVGAAHRFAFYGSAAERLLARFVQDIGARPGHAVEHDQPQGAAWYVDAISDGIGAEQAGIFLGAENVDQGGGVHAVDVLRVERDTRFFQRLGDATLHVAQAANGGK